MSPNTLLWRNFYQKSHITDVVQAIKKHSLIFWWCEIYIYIGRYLWLSTMSLNASRHLPDHMTGEVNRSTCWRRDYEWRHELWGWRGGRGRGRGRGGDDGGREGWRGWKISVSCPRVGEFFACRLGNTKGRWKRGLVESEGRKSSEF